MFGYSFTQLFFFLKHYGLIDLSFEQDFEKSIELLNKRKEHTNGSASLSR